VIALDLQLSPSEVPQMISFSTFHSYKFVVFPLPNQEVESRQRCVPFPFCAYTLTCKQERFYYSEVSMDLKEIGETEAQCLADQT